MLRHKPSAKATESPRPPAVAGKRHGKMGQKKARKKGRAAQADAVRSPHKRALRAADGGQSTGRELIEPPGVAPKRRKMLSGDPAERVAANNGGPHRAEGSAGARKAPKRQEVASSKTRKTGKRDGQEPGSATGGGEGKPLPRRAPPPPPPPLGGRREEQAAWLWSAYLGSHMGAKLSSLEREPFGGEAMVLLEQLPGKDRMATLAAHGERLLGPLWGQLRGGASPPAADGEEGGAPTLLAICPSALRCTAVLRAIRPWGPRLRAAKLFAKHMKVAEQVKALRQPVHVAAGTPARIGQLVDLGALSLRNLRVLLLDLQPTAKDLTLLDIPETRADFWDLFHRSLLALVRQHSLQICLS